MENIALSAFRRIFYRLTGDRMNRVKQGCCEFLASYPLLRIFAKQVRENGIDFQEVSR